MPELPTVPTAPLSPEAAPAPPFWDRLLRGNFWLAAVVRVILYGVLFGGIASGISRAVRFFLGREHALSPLRGLFVGECIGVAAALGAVLLMALLEKRRPGVYGLPLQGAFGKLFWQGALAGLLEISVLMALIAACGGYSFGGLAVQGLELARWAGFWALLFVVVGLFEEFLFRGYAQYTLGAALGFWPAALLLSALFGAAHLRNPGEGWVGALSILEVGIVLCLTLRRTGNLWFAVGLHASFDFGETFLYSVPNSGFVTAGHLSHAALHGPAWLTGGSVGPEGSLFSFLTMAIMFYAIHLLYPAKEEAVENA